ncbi:MAG: DUF1045 domain-containing protein [Pseudomonadota bacterium]
MPDYTRYAVYYIPDDARLLAFGAHWLGWDSTQAARVAQAAVEGIADATSAPRKYGFHGTLKAPFRLAPGITLADLQNAVSTVAAQQRALQVKALTLGQLGSFIALVPKGDASELGALAQACVADIDHLRAAPTEEELARRRKAGLTPAQDALLRRWGYPYVFNEFRFHMTLTGRLAPDDLMRFHDALERALPPLPRPFEIASVALLGERPDGFFELIERFPLGRGD